MNLWIEGQLAILLVCQIFLFSLHFNRNDRAMRRAFEALEDDFEDLREHMASVLGRAARLKRATLEEARTTQPTESEVPGTVGFPLTPRQRQIQHQVLTRRGEREAKPS